MVTLVMEILADSFTATATDAAGNTINSSITLTIRKADNISPTISSFTADDTSVSLTTSSQSQTVTFTVVASDNRAVSTVSLPELHLLVHQEIIIHSLKHMFIPTTVSAILVIH